MSLLKALGLTGRGKNAAQPESAFIERRAEERRPVFQDAELILEDYCKLRVVITDLSSRGARIAYATRMDLPFRVRLNAPSIKRNCWARVAWQNETVAGLEFLEDD